LVECGASCLVVDVQDGFDVVDVKHVVCSKFMR
jgi:hypothetical protein